MTMTTSSFAKALYPGVSAWYGRKYEEHPEQYSQLFDKFTSRRAFEEDVSISGFGLASVKSEGSAIAYDNEQQGFVTRYDMLTYGLGFTVTREMFDDDMYDVAAQRKAESLAMSMRQTKEIVGANVYNRAFSGSYLGTGSKALLASDHPNVAGGTYSNMPTVAADLSEAALEQAVIDIKKYTNDRGLRVNIMPQKLILPVDLEFEAERILGSALRVGTANNDLNAIKSLGKFPGGVVTNNYLTDTDAWFIRTSAPHGMKFFQRRAMEFTIDNDFDSENAKFKATERFAFGWTDPRGLYGSAGA